MKTNELDPKLHTYLKGYWNALYDFGIWKDGTQVIGCLEHPIKEVMQKKLDEFDIELSDFMETA